MAEEEQDIQPASSIFDGLYPQPRAGYLNTKDVTDDRLYLSPQEQEAFSQYQSQQMDPTTGALRMSDYYPGFTNGGAVGTYSGNQIGSVSLFGGGGALVPIGMMDARDAALTRATLQKQKEVADFRKQFDKAPVSKLTNINQGLGNGYIDLVDKTWQKSLKKANGNPNVASRIMDNDIEFKKQLRSYEDLARQGDAVVGKIADIEARVKAGDVMSPALIEAKNRVLMDMNPDSPGFRHLSNSIIRMDADREFSDAANEALMRVVPNETGQAWDRSNADQMRVFKESVEKLSPETKQSVIDNLKKIYEGSTMYSPEYIERNAGGLMNWEKTKQDLHLSQKRENTDNYSNDSVIERSNEKNTTVRGNINSYTEHFVPTNAADQKKELKFAISDDIVSADGEPVNGDKSGYVSGFVQGIGVKPYYKNEKRFLTQKESDAVNERGDFETTDNIEMRPVVIFNVKSPSKETTDEAGNTITVPGEQKTVYFDTKKIAGMFSGNKGSDYESMRLKTEKYAEERNKDRKPTSSKKTEQASSNKKDWSKYKRQ